MADPPVRFILDSEPWQRGYELAVERADNEPPASLTNPFDMGDGDWFGFEEGRLDAAKDQHGKTVANPSPSGGQP